MRELSAILPDLTRLVGELIAVLDADRFPSAEQRQAYARLVHELRVYPELSGLWFALNAAAAWMSEAAAEAGQADAPPGLAPAMALDQLQLARRELGHRRGA